MASKHGFDPNILKLNFCFVLLGLTALFGEFLHELSPSVITLGRTFFAAIFLLVYIFFMRRKFSVVRKLHVLGFVVAGALLSFHWMAFFQSVQLGSVAIAVLTVTTFPVFAALLEPFVFKEKFSLKNTALSFVCLIGVYLVVPDIDLASESFQAVLWGISAGFTFAILSLLNRYLARSYTDDVLTFYQLAFSVQCLVASFFLFPVGLETFLGLGLYELSLLVLLGGLFTALPHTLIISSLRHVKVQTVGIISTLEPVYGIIFAWVLLDESVTLNMLFGGAVILFSVFLISKNKEEL